MLSRFDSFCAYTTDGRLECDNNAVERTIRPFAIGRRHWLFAGSHHGAKMTAAALTVVQTCKALKIDPQQYLTDVLPRLANHQTTSLEGLTPIDWKKPQ